MENNKNLKAEEEIIEQKQKAAQEKAEIEAEIVQRTQEAQLKQATERELQQRMIIQAAQQQAQILAQRAQTDEEEKKKKNPAKKLAKKILWWTAGIPSGMGIISILSGEPSTETAQLPIELLKRFLA